MAPEWVHVCPAGEVGEDGRRVVRGRDGREFEVGDPAAVISRTELPAQFDWDHESMFFFGSSRAAGWIDRLEFLEEPDESRPEEGFWAHVERWTPDGRSDVENGYFRGLSPVVRWQHREPDREGDEPPPPLLLELVNVALTNRPNLRMTLLNSEEPNSRTPGVQGDESMNEHERRLRARLGLPETANAEEVARVAFNTLETSVPRTDLDAANARAEAAETQLTEHRQAAHQVAVDVALNTARTEGRIAPASIEHYRRMCSSPEGLASFQELAATLPRIVAADPHSDANPPGSDLAALTENEKRIAAELGLTEEQYAAAKAG